MARYDTTLEAAGAEHLVIGHLLIERIQAFRAHANQAGYDLLAVDPDTGRSVRVQVKSRVAVDSGPSKVKHQDYDFAVIVRLNRGTKASLRHGVAQGTQEPEIYVLPKGLIESDASGGRITPRLLSTLGKYRNNWQQIRSALQSDPEQPGVDPA